MSKQRWYAIEAHRHGEGHWVRRLPTFPSREHAKAWARERNHLPQEEAVNGAKQLVYRIIEIDAATEAE